VTQLSSAGKRHVIMPEGAKVMSHESGDHPASVTINELPATPSEIDYLTRLMMEYLNTTASPPLASSAAAGQP
jgi:hypothetical protein